MGKVLLTALCLLLGGGAGADEFNPARHHPATTSFAGTELRVIVKLRSGDAPAATDAGKRGDSVSGIASRTGLAFKQTRRLGDELRVVTIDAAGTVPEREAALAALRSDPLVAYAEVDQFRYPHALPNDALYPGQWYLHDAPETPSAIDAEGAWDVVTGSAGVVVAVVDTGVLFSHPDLQRAGSGGRVLPGFDFVSDATIANDGDGRDADASDPGDWVTTAETESAPFTNCSAAPSSWHGTRIAGIIGAVANNSTGIAGGTWEGWILPVRVLGKCGGYDSDILAGMLWAAGLSVDGVPDNPFPANVENVSFGAGDACTQSYADVIDELAQAGVLVVSSVGNGGALVEVPASCPGVLAVAGLRHAGTKVGYSNLGPEVSIGAPAGNCVNLSGACIYPIDTTSNAGTTTPSTNTYTDQLNANVGTSFAAPIATAITGLMLSVNGNLGPGALVARIREGAATPFPVSTDASIPDCHVPESALDAQLAECNCTTETCGAGMADAVGAVDAALRPIAAIAVPASVSPGQDVVLSAAGSRAACGFALATYEWSIVDGSGAGLSMTDPETAVVTAPASGTVTVRVTVTDDAGRTDSADAIVAPDAVSTTAPALAGNGACPAARELPAPVVDVFVSPRSAGLRINGTLTFSATVSGASDPSVTWQVDGIAGGNATVGTITADGVYRAPATVPAGVAVTVSAVSVADPTRSGSALVTISGTAAGGGSGGGGIDPLLLTLLVLLVPSVRASTRRATS